MLDDRGLAFLERGGRGRFRFREVDGGIGELGEHGIHGFGFRLSVVPVDRFDDLFARGENGLYIFVQNELEFLHRIEVAGIAHDDLERAVLLGERKNEILARHRFGDQFDDGGGDGDVGKVDKLQPMKLGDGRHDLVHRGVFELNEGVLQFDAGGLLQSLRFFELVGTKNLSAN
jgi:hypothetical protein